MGEVRMNMDSFKKSVGNFSYTDQGLCRKDMMDKMEKVDKDQ